MTRSEATLADLRKEMIRVEMIASVKDSGRVSTFPLPLVDLTVLRQKLGSGKTLTTNI